MKARTTKLSKSQDHKDFKEPEYTDLRKRAQEALDAGYALTVVNAKELLKILNER